MSSDLTLFANLDGLFGDVTDKFRGSPEITSTRAGAAASRLREPVATSGNVLIARAGNKGTIGRVARE